MRASCPRRSRHAILIRKGLSFDIHTSADTLTLLVTTSRRYGPPRETNAAAVAPTLTPHALMIGMILLAVTAAWAIRRRTR